MHKKVITLFGPKNVLHHWSSITSLTFAENHSDIAVITLTVVITLLVATILTPVPHIEIMSCIFIGHLVFNCQKYMEAFFNPPGT